ncbi:MAG: hypothetical protein FVQ80_07420 [Planctomycetes bacterium]|nr:hypothetical protein [Planctomycetota bacterium]
MKTTPKVNLGAKYLWIPNQVRNDKWGGTLRYRLGSDGGSIDLLVWLYLLGIASFFLTGNHGFTRG